MENTESIKVKEGSSSKNKITGKRNPATSKYIKTISQSDLQKIENELKSIVENNSSNSIRQKTCNIF